MIAWAASNRCGWVVTSRGAESFDIGTNGLASGPNVGAIGVMLGPFADVALLLVVGFKGWRGA